MRNKKFFHAIITFVIPIIIWITTYCFLRPSEQFAINIFTVILALIGVLVGAVGLIYGAIISIGSENPGKKEDIIVLVKEIKSDVKFAFINILIVTLAELIKHSSVFEYEKGILDKNTAANAIVLVSFYFSLLIFWDITNASFIVLESILLSKKSEK